MPFMNTDLHVDAFVIPHSLCEKKSKCEAERRRLEGW